MSDTWTINIDSRVYGPYSAEQMQIFRDQGRLAAHSLVARTGEDRFHPAGEDSELALLFAAAAQEPARPVVRAPQDNVEAKQPAKFGREAEAASNGERNRYVILSDLKSSSISGLDDEIANLGPSARIMPQAWILHSEITLNALRTALLQKLGKLDQLFVADTTHDKAAWFNFGPELETKTRSLWSRQDQRKAG